jgi:hypothetical protein
MSTKSIHLNGSEPHTHVKPSPWSTRTRVFLATLGLLAFAYVLWQLFRAEPPLPIPDTPVLPLPAP